MQNQESSWTLFTGHQKVTRQCLEFQIHIPDRHRVSLLLQPLDYALTRLDDARPSLINLLLASQYAIPTRLCTRFASTHLSTYI